jgi:hypothetical protein
MKMPYLVSVERKEKIECVLIEYLDSRIEKCDGEKLPIGAIANGQDVIGHFEGARVDKRYDFPALGRRSCVKRKLL